MSAEVRDDWSINRQHARTVRRTGGGRGGGRPGGVGRAKLGDSAGLAGSGRDTSGVSMMDLEAVRAALRAQKPDLLLEQPEGQ
jgi:hypothetical protein